jgi:hypothetical protein
MIFVGGMVLYEGSVARWPSRHKHTSKSQHFVRIRHESRCTKPLICYLYLADLTQQGCTGSFGLRVWILSGTSGDQIRRWLASPFTRASDTAIQESFTAGVIFGDINNPRTIVRSLQLWYSIRSDRKAEMCIEERSSLMRDNIEHDASGLE